MRRRWEVREEYDYILEPEELGIEASTSLSMRSDRLVEIQLRTEGQHNWAEAVEYLGNRTGFNLKDGQGRKNYFTISSERRMVGPYRSRGSRCREASARSSTG